MTAFLAGFSLAFSLILAIGAQNAFVLRQGLRRAHVFAVSLTCAVSDAILIAAGVAGFGWIAEAFPWVAPVLQWGGAGLALVAAGAAAALGRRGALVGVPIMLAILCAASELWLSPAVAAVRPSSLGAAVTAETSSRFALLHALSLGLFLAIHVGSIALLVWHARIDARESN